MSKRIGSSLRSLFAELGEEEDLDLLTRKKVLADQIAEHMKRMNLTATSLAAAMHTSRSVVYRLLDPTNTGVTIETLSRASRALDVELFIAFAPRRKTTTAPRPARRPAQATRAKA